MKLKRYDRNRIMDALYREEISLNKVKVYFMLEGRLPARKAKQLAIELLNEGIEYWHYDGY
ncbi:hypothetical protein EJP02_479 [Escherichia phage EJP2]|nr:hypothetical protein EJP02_479 [Escherichia phage EJP2]